jgi:hypothetical protein
MNRLVSRALGVSVIAVAFVVLGAAIVDAQAVKGGLVGNIVDASALALPGVTVTITEVNTNISYTAVTNESGNYVFANLKDGTYRVSGELTGFKKAVREGVIVPVNAIAASTSGWRSAPSKNQ